MKSLQESLFDDNIKKGVTFGNLFKLTGTRFLLKKPSSGWKSSGRGWRQGSDEYKLSDLYDYRQISKDSKVSGDPDEIVSKGLLKLINEIPITPDNTFIDVFDQILRGFEKYYKSIVRNTHRLACRSRVGLYNQSDNSFKDNKIDKFDLLEIDKASIQLCGIEFNFEKK